MLNSCMLDIQVLTTYDLPGGDEVSPVGHDGSRELGLGPGEVLGEGSEALDQRGPEHVGQLLPTHTPVLLRTNAHVFIHEPWDCSLLAIYSNLWCPPTTMCHRSFVTFEEVDT